MRNLRSTSKFVGVLAVLAVCCSAQQRRATCLPSSSNRSPIMGPQIAEVTARDSGVEFQATVPLGGFETTTVLAVSNNPALIGTPLTLTASVSTLAFGRTPTGTVRFLDSSTVMGESLLRTHCGAVISPR